MKPSKVKALKKAVAVHKSVNKPCGSISADPITLNSHKIPRKITELLAASSSYGYWHGLFAIGNAEPYPKLDPGTEPLREEVQAAIHHGFEEGRGRRTGTKNTPMEPPRISQD